MTDTPESVYVAAATASVRAEGVNDGYIASTAQEQPFRAAVDAAYAETLRGVYWHFRQHADAYRDTNGYRRAQQAWEASGRRDDNLLRKLTVHVHYARGIDAAAREVADMLGVPEHEIEPVDD